MIVMASNFKKTITIGTVISIIILLAIWAVALSTNKATQNVNEVMKGSQKSTAQSQSIQDTVPNENTIDSRYRFYTKDILDSTTEFRRVLYFYASWCPTCRPVDEYLSQNASQIPNDLLIIRVNYNDPETDEEEKSLARTHGITYQHTFVQIDSDGKEITKWNGGSLSEILSNIQE